MLNIRLKNIFLCALLSSGTVFAADDSQEVLNDVAGVGRRLDGWGDNESVMRPQRRKMCQESAELLSAILSAEPIDETQCLTEMGEWLNSLKGDSVTYVSKFMNRRIGTRNRNYIDDAITGLQYIGGEFSEKINGETKTIQYVLAMVWTAIKYHEYLTTSILRENPDKIQKDKENMKLTLLKKGLAEIVEDAGYIVCSVGKSQRILLCLQGYFDGINIDGVYTLNGTDAEVEVNGQQFADTFQTVLTAWINRLNATHPLQKLTVELTLYPNVSKEKLLELLVRIRNNWIDAAKTVLKDTADIKKAVKVIQDAINKYEVLLNGSEVKVDDKLSDYTSPLDADIDGVFYHKPAASSGDAKKAATSISEVSTAVPRATSSFTTASSSNGRSHNVQSGYGAALPSWRMVYPWGNVASYSAPRTAPISQQQASVIVQNPQNGQITKVVSGKQQVID